MKIPNYMYEPVYTLINFRQIARMLEIEANEYRIIGRHNAASALRCAAQALKEVGRDKSPAKAFGWNERATTKSAGEPK